MDTRIGESPDQTDDRTPVGTPIQFDGEWHLIGVVTSRPIEGDEDGFDLGTPAAEKARTLRAEAHELTTRAQRLSAGPERDWALARAGRYLRRSHALTGITRIHVCTTGRREARPAATRRASSSSRTSGADPGSPDDSDPEPSEEGLCDCGCDQSRRFCACGCRREITHRRADAKTFGASCRQRLKRANDRVACHPLEPRFCQCESGFFYRDAEGDAVCGLCGCWLAKVATRINGFDAFDALLRSNGTYVARRLVPREWRLARKAVAS